jgi:hypothetical protein
MWLSGSLKRKVWLSNCGGAAASAQVTTSCMSHATNSRCHKPNDTTAGQHAAPKDPRRVAPNGDAGCGSLFHFGPERMLPVAAGADVVEQHGGAGRDVGGAAVDENALREVDHLG